MECKVDYLVFGYKGYFGSHVVKHLSLQGKSYATSDTRIENRESIIKDLDFYNPKYVICAAGLTGTPNVSWFENNKQEGIRVNVMATLNVVDLCFMRNIHCTVFGTGMLYNYDSDHPLGSGIGFKEEEAPNYQELYYIKLRVILEDLLSAYSNVLNLRVIYPISDDLHNKSLLTKLLNFKKVVSVQNSITVIDDLWPLITVMCENNVTGNYNFSNPGVVDNNYILECYKKYVDSSIEWELADERDHENHMKVRPNQELDVSKLKSLFPSIECAKLSVEKLMQRISHRRTTFK